jgi:hypothetical protein
MGRVIHADVPHTRSTPRALDPLFVLANASVFALHAPALLSARVGFAESLQPLVEAAQDVSTARHPRAPALTDATERKRCRRWPCHAYASWSRS